jgi:translation initiation factor IF-1
VYVVTKTISAMLGNRWFTFNADNEIPDFAEVVGDLRIFMLTNHIVLL